MKKHHSNHILLNIWRGFPVSENYKNVRIKIYQIIQTNFSNIYV